MTIYRELIQRVDAGETFHIDFEKRNMKVGKDYLIKNGEYNTEKTLIALDVMSLEDIIRMIVELYSEYKYSLPSERSENNRKKYFKALPMEKIEDSYLFNPIRRDLAQATLEGFILCMILNGSFVWDEEKMGKWFWQSKNDPDLVILRSWVENN